MIDAIQFVASLNDLPQAPRQSRQGVIATLRTFAQATRWARDEAAAGRDVTASLDEWLAEKSDFSEIRASALRLLVLPAEATLQFAKTDQKEVDLESWTIQLLSGSLAMSSEAFAVRKAAAQALASYAATELGMAKITEARSLINTELKLSKSSRQREELRQLLTILVATTRD